MRLRGVITDKEGCNISDMYSTCSRFESWPGHMLFSVRSLCVSVPPDKIQNNNSNYKPLASLCLILNLLLNTVKSRDSSVGIATGYRLDDRGGRSSSPGKVKNFLFFISSRPALWTTQPPIQWVPRALSPGGKAAGA
jgi:hypothetical protein